LFFDLLGVIVASIDEFLTKLELNSVVDLVDDWFEEEAVKLHPVNKLEAPVLEFVIKLFSIGLLAMRLLLIDDEEDDVIV
jgi:hypothetical protein